MPTLEERITALEASVGRLTEVLTDTVATLKDLAGSLKPTAGILEELAALVKNLVEAQLRTERRLEELTARVEALAEAQGRTEERVGRLEETVGQVEDRLGRVEDALARLAEAQARTEERVSRVEEALARLAEAQAKTEEALRILVDRVGELDGFYQELRFVRRAPAVLGRAGFRKVRVVGPEELADRLDDLEEQGLISPAERNRLVETDLIVRARRDGQEVWVAVEVSSTVGVRDVERAAESAALLARILGAPAVAAVAGRRIGPAAAAAAQDRGVLILSQA